MKKFIVLAMLILCFTLSSCSTKEPKGEANKQKEDITLKVKENEITKSTKELTLVLTNNSNNEYTYGAKSILEIKKNNEFTECPLMAEVAWIDIAYVLEPNETAELGFRIEILYDKLQPGTYRVVKDVISNGKVSTVSAEFELK